MAARRRLLYRRRKRRMKMSEKKYCRCGRRAVRNSIIGAMGGPVNRWFCDDCHDAAVALSNRQGYISSSQFETVMRERTEREADEEL